MFFWFISYLNECNEPFCAPLKKTTLIPQSTQLPAALIFIPRKFDSTDRLWLSYLLLSYLYYPDIMQKYIGCHMFQSS